MLLLTTPTLPQGLVVTKAFSMLLASKTIELSYKGLVRSITERNRNEYTEAIDYFMSLAPKEANAIIGVQISTATQSFSNGSFLYMTFVGTPVVYEDV